MDDIQELCNGNLELEIPIYKYLADYYQEKNLRVFNSVEAASKELIARFHCERVPAEIFKKWCNVVVRMSYR